MTTTTIKRIVVPPLPLLLRRSDVCKICNITRKKVELLCSSGRLKSNRDWQGLTIAREDLIKFLHKNGYETDSPESPVDDLAEQAGKSSKRKLPGDDMKLIEFSIRFTGPRKRGIPKPRGGCIKFRSAISVGTWAGRRC